MLFDWVGLRALVLLVAVVVGLAVVVVRLDASFAFEVEWVGECTMYGWLL